MPMRHIAEMLENNRGIAQVRTHWDTPRGSPVICCWVNADAARRQSLHAHMAGVESGRLAAVRREEWGVRSLMSRREGGRA